METDQPVYDGKKKAMEQKSIITAIVLTFVMLGAMLSGCTGAAPEQIQLSVNGEEYVLPLTERDTVDLVTLSTEFDAEVAVANYRRFDRISVDEVQLKKGAAAVPVDQIGKDKFLALNWTRGTQSGMVLLRTLHPLVPDILASGTATSPGDFYLSYVYRRLIQKTDNAGNILFYRVNPEMVDLIDGQPQSNGWWDFKKHVADGVTYYSYHAPDPAQADKAFAGYNPGKRVLMDERYRPVQEFQLLGSRDGFVKEGDPIDGHDFWFFSPEHYIMSAYILRDGVYAAYLQEVENGKVVFDWWSTEHPEMALWLDPAFRETAGADYVHFNAIDILPDGNWLCSFRHVSSLVKIDRADETGDILWRIDGTSLPRTYDFHGQHYARWHQDDGGSFITLFNNGNGQGATSMVRLDVDLANGAVSGGTRLIADGHFSEACGALTFSGKNAIVGWGIPEGSQAGPFRLLTEYDATGHAVFFLHLNTEDRATGPLASYRCIKM